jgi:para-nitrobenzyl esterase
VVPEAPLAGIREGVQAGVPVLTRTNREEMSVFSIGDRGSFGMSQEQLLKRLTRLLGSGDDAQQAADTYAKARADRGEPSSPSDVWMAIQSDYVFRVPCIRLLESHREHAETFGYLFTWPSPALGGLLGSCHALEIPFVFGHLDLPNVAMFTGSGADADRLSTRMQDAWISFARTGRPTVEDLGPWPAYGANRSTMVLDAHCAVEDDPMSPERAFWDGRL